MDPAWWDQVPPPNPAANERVLDNLPPNTWVKLEQPRVCGRRDRNYGTAVFDTDRQQIIVFSGGHATYAGNDVLLYSTRANTWRMGAAPEFPEGYGNGDSGRQRQVMTFNDHPFMLTHTYKMYGYDTVGRKMILRARQYTFIFDPLSAEWVRPPLPSSFNWMGQGARAKFLWTPRGVVVWAGDGTLHKFDWKRRKWRTLPVSGEPLPRPGQFGFGGGVYDSKRHRLILFSMVFGARAWTGIGTYDLKTGVYRSLSPPNAADYLKVVHPREAVYLPAGDLVLFMSDSTAMTGTVMDHVVYDIKANRFRRLLLKNPSPLPKREGVPHWGLMYDPARDLVWAVCTDNVRSVRVMRFDPETAKIVDRKGAPGDERC